jgi:putative flippase GtrA
MIELSKKVLKLKVVRYFFTALTATGVDLTVYFIACNFIFKNQDHRLFNLVTLSASTMSLCISFSCGLVTNFTLTKIFVFHDSDLRTRHQFMRYTAVALVFFGLNYLMMKYLIGHFELLSVHTTIARGITAVSIGVLSFITHKFFSFKVNNTEEVDENTV